MEVLTEEEYFNRYYPAEFGNWKEYYNISAYRKEKFTGVAWMCYKKYGSVYSEINGKMKIGKWNDSYNPYMDSFFLEVDEVDMEFLCPYETEDNKTWAQVSLQKEESNLDLYLIKIEGCDDASWSHHIIGIDEVEKMINRLKMGIEYEDFEKLNFFFSN